MTEHKKGRSVVTQALSIQLMSDMGCRHRGGRVAYILMH